MITSPYDRAAPFWARNWNVLALNGKRPIEPNWSRWCIDRQSPDHIDRYLELPSQTNIGLPLGQRRLLAIDVDTDKPEFVESILGVLPPVKAAKRGKRGFTAFYYAATDDIRTQRLGIVEVLYRGAQTVVPPSVHPDNGHPYIWLDPRGLEV